MKLLEYEAKNLLKKSGINVPTSQIISNKENAEVNLPTVLKSQVPTGGRGKVGGIVIVKESSQLEFSINTLLKLKIKGYLPKTLLAEEILNIKHEYYISVLIDKKSANIQLVANKNGGIEVENNKQDSFLRLNLDEDNLPKAGKELSELYGLPDMAQNLQELTENLASCLIDNDAVLVEINPLVITDNNSLVAADAKIELDDSASFRHVEWKFEQAQTANNFVILNENGQIATIANGAGLAMATVDAVADYGMEPANFLDIGGGANSESILKAFSKIMEFKKIDAIIINIFAGITKCDEVAKAIIEAKKHIKNLPPLYIRLSGNNLSEAEALLHKNSIELLPTLEACLISAKKEVTHG